jgi:uncharacterized protein involved in high-affinity Fe2+ transport
MVREGLVSAAAGYRSDMDPHGHTTPASSALIHLDDDVDVAAQLVQRFGYDEAERIMLDALDDATSVDEEAQRADTNQTV